MGCASSNVKIVEPPNLEQNSPVTNDIHLPDDETAIESRLKQFNDNPRASNAESTSGYGSMENLKNITSEDVRRLSVLTMRSGSIQLKQIVDQNDSPKMVTRDIETGQTLLHPKTSVVSPFNPYLRDVSNRMTSGLKLPGGVSASMPNTPMLGLKERRISKQKVRFNDDSNLDETQIRLDQALRELSRSLSESHGSIFHLNSSDNRQFEAGSGSLSPALSHVSASESAPNNVVLNIGSGFCKVGVSSDDIPSVVMPTLVGRPRDQHTLGIPLLTSFVGKDALLRKEALTISRPVVRDRVVDWDGWEKIVQHILDMELQVDRKDLGVVLPERALSTRESREKATQVMFEKVGVSRLYQGPSAPMSLHAFSMTTGLVVTIGYDITSCVPVINGNVIEEGIRHMELGGDDVTKKLQKLIGTRKLVKEQECDIARSMMERLCFVGNATMSHHGSTVHNNAVTSNHGTGTSHDGTDTAKSYSLPGGETINLEKERFMAPEILFRPDLAKNGDEQLSDGRGLHHICAESIEACRDDVRDILYKHVVLVGGTTLMNGLAQRLQDEMGALLPQQAAGAIEVHALPQRQYAVWRGASLMTSLNSSRGRWMTRKEYEEEGASIVHRKYV